MPVFNCTSGLRLAAWGAVVCGAAVFAAEVDDLPPSHSVRADLYATGFEWADGPTFDREGNLYAANYRGNGNVGRITPDGTASIFGVLQQLVPVEGREPQVGGMKVDGEGRLIVADRGAGRLLRIAADGKSGEMLADRSEGMRFHAVRDVALDMEGNIFFSDSSGSSLQNPIGSIYRYDINTKRVTRLATGLAAPAGLAVAPNQQLLCVAESLRFRLLAFELSPEGEVVGRRVLIQFPRQEEGEFRGGAFAPEGIVFDARGRLYAAMAGGGVVNVVTVPEGKLVRQYDAGGAQVTNLHFHGPFLYTAVASKEAVFRLRLETPGFAYNGPQ